MYNVTEAQGGCESLGTRLPLDVYYEATAI